MRNQLPDQSIYSAIITFPVVFTDLRIGIRTQNSKLVSVDFLSPATPVKQAGDDTALRVVDLLKAYFINSNVEFDIPLLIQGSGFQQKVWRVLRTIPPGQTCSYAHIAMQLNSSARAVGNACRANAVPIIIPCHRVVAKNGPGGYCGQTGGERLQIKHWLLQHERA